MMKKECYVLESKEEWKFDNKKKSEKVNKFSQ